MNRQIVRSEVIECMRRSSATPPAVRAHLGKLNTQAQDAVDLHLPKILRTGGLLILSGNPGNGKSYALHYAAAAFDLYGGGYFGARFCSARAVLMLQKEDPRNWEGTMKRRALLCIDELGGEDLGVNRYLLPHWDEFFDYRYRERLPIVGATNLGAPDFKAHYGERITDRMREWATWVDISGESLRGVHAKAEEIVPAEIERTPEAIDPATAALRAEAKAAGLSIPALLAKKMRPVTATPRAGRAAQRAETAQDGPEGGEAA